MISTKKMPITKARINLGSVVESVRTKGEQIILEKGGIPVAALVNIEFIEDILDSLEIMQARKSTQKDKNIDWKDIRNKYV